MTLQQLEYIIALDNYRHYVTAAKKSFVSQPNLTTQVKKLEEELGVRIFDRNKKPLEPTSSGRQIIDRARRILREVHQLQETISDERESIAGEFRLGIIPTLAPYLLPRFLPSFLKAHPETHFVIREIQTEQIIDHLEKGLLDLSLLVTPLEVPAIREVPIYNEPFLLYLPSNHKLIEKKEIKTRDLDSSEILILQEGHCFREQALAICNRKEDINQSGFEYQSGSIEALKSLVKQGLGITLVPELSVLDKQEPENIRRFSSPEPVREVSLAVHTNFTRENLLNKVHASIQAVLPRSFTKHNRYVRINWR